MNRAWQATSAMSWQLPSNAAIPALPSTYAAWPTPALITAHIKAATMVGTWTPLPAMVLRNESLWADESKGNVLKLCIASAAS